MATSNVRVQSDSGSGLWAVARVNGRVRCQVLIFAHPEDETPLVHERIDLSSSEDRTNLLAKLPDVHRVDAAPVLEKLAVVAIANPKNRTAEKDETPLPPEFGEDALALEFTRRHKDELRYTDEWSQWNRWDGTRWRKDSTLHVYDLSRAVCRAAAIRCAEPKVALQLSRASTTAAVERHARAAREHAVESSVWDRDRWLLNTPGGTIDLRTGKLRKARPSDYLTRSTAVAPTDESECPRWLTFLEDATKGDAELIAFLKRMCGYTLTGDIREHALFFIFGPGGAGKGTFLHTSEGILGEYAVTSPIETFTENKGGDRHPTELARLRGARLVTSQETEEGRRWAESRVKALTGGDRITARFMRGDFFEFMPEFKLVIAGNHQPHLRCVDEAIRRRLHLIPFLHKVADEKRDLQLRETLQHEWPAILAWMVQGTLEWLEVGLRAPECVRIATNEYLETEDTFGAWLDECCVVGANLSASTGDLWRSWQIFAERASEFAGSAKRFTMTLQKRGFIAGRSNTSRFFTGLALRPHESRAGGDGL